MKTVLNAECVREENVKLKVPLFERKLVNRQTFKAKQNFLLASRANFQKF